MHLKALLFLFIWLVSGFAWYFSTNDVLILERPCTLDRITDQEHWLHQLNGSSIEQIWNSDFFVFDWNIYYQTEVMSWSIYDDFEVLQKSCQLDCLSNDEKRSFTPLEYWYARSHKRVFISCKELRWADPDSFQIVWGGYTKDTSSVFYNWKKMDEVDAPTFKYNKDKCFGEDANNRYLQWEKITIKVDSSYCKAYNSTPPSLPQIWY